MTDYEFIGETIYNSTAVSDIAGTRVYYGEIPKTDTTLPAVCYFQVSGVNLVNGHLARPRYQIDCRAESYSVSKTLADKIKRAFNELQTGSTGSFDCQNARFESEQTIHEQDGTWNSPVDIILSYFNS